MVVATFTHRADRILLVLAISIMVGQYKHEEAKLGALGDTLVMETTLNVVLETDNIVMLVWKARNLVVLNTN